MGPERLLEVVELFHSPEPMMRVVNQYDERHSNPKGLFPAFSEETLCEESLESSFGAASVGTSATVMDWLSTVVESAMPEYSIFFRGRCGQRMNLAGDLQETSKDWLGIGAKSPIFFVEDYLVVKCQATAH